MCRVVATSGIAAASTARTDDNARVEKSGEIDVLVPFSKSLVGFEMNAEILR